jgi:branched-chain amino acid transport system ATP-binding protein
VSRTAPHLVVEDIVAGYATGQPILRGVSLSAKPGRITVILGPNGAGKSTLLKVVAGFLPPVSGRVLADADEIGHLPAHDHLTRGIGLLPQGRSTFPQLTVAENIELGGWAIRGDRAGMKAAVAAIYERYPMLKDWRHKPAGSLSGGQQRTVEIARLLVSDPRLLLIDEPSAGLSPIVAEKVYEELVALREEGRTILLVDQDVRPAVRIADHVYVLASGRNDIDGDRSAFEGDLGAIVRGWLGV